MTTRKAKALHSAESVEQYTPPEIADAARYVLVDPCGRIALDPASSEFANRVVQAKTIYTGPPNGTDGLAAPWFGPLFVNPPGKSKLNPGGQAAWWEKLIKEWSQRRFDAIFLGFSLELLQTAQRYDGFQPLDFPHCIPRKRIAFDRRARDLLPKLEEESRKPGLLSPLGLKKQDKRLAEVRELAAVDGRVKGTQPTHGNIIVCVSTSSYVVERFRDKFAEFGYTR